ETTDLEEGGAADGTAARPEGGGLFAGLLVRVVVEQVLVLGDKVGGGRLLVVRAHDRYGFWLLAKGGGDLGDDLGADLDVRLQEEAAAADPLRRGRRCHADALGPQVGRHSMWASLARAKRDTP